MMNRNVSVSDDGMLLKVKRKFCSLQDAKLAKFQFPIQYQDVMVVGEPSMMGGEYGEEDERTISRVENTQFDPNAIQTPLSTMSQQMPASMATLGGPPPQS